MWFKGGFPTLRKLRIFFMICIFITFITVCSSPAAAATPPDIIHQMKVTITPQADGSLNIHYFLDYEATTDFPADICYLEIGVPNSSFTLLDYSPDTLISGAGRTKAAPRRSIWILRSCQEPGTDSSWSLQ
jgi:hypothetical protein